MITGADRPLPTSAENPALDPATDATLGQDLPAFNNPPVIEVATSLQFNAIKGLDAARSGLLWSEYRNRYPQVEVQPPLSEAKETFGQPTPPKVSFTVGPLPTAMRFWFLNEDGTELLQIQPDRFVLNWRKMETEKEYPHYVQLRRRLIEEFSLFEDFLREEKLPPPVLNQAELTYVNHIPLRVGGSQIAVQRILRLWGGEPQESPLPVPEDLTLQTRYVMSGPDGPRGRLYLTVDTRQRVADNAPVLVLQFVARGAPEGPGLAGALRLMDQGHRWIVQSFADITTPEMHRIWERTDDKGSGVR